MTEPFNGHDRRECGDHRTTGARAWCYDDHSWCSPAVPCRGCELPLVLQRAEQAERERDEQRKRAEHLERERDVAVAAAVDEATLGYRRQLEEAGWSPTAAEHMALAFHQMLMSQFRGGASG